MSVMLCKKPSIQTLWKALVWLEKTFPLRLFSPKFLVILQRAGNYKDLMCIGLNPSCSSRIGSRSLTTYKIPGNIITKID